MRQSLAVTAGLLSFVLAMPAEAQQILTPQSARSLVGGVTSRPIQMKAVDTSRALAPMNIGSTFKAPRPPATFTLSRFFPKITAGPWPPRLPNLLAAFKAPPAPAPVNPQRALRFPNH
jgi:hypothetical protein